MDARDFLMDRMPRHRPSLDALRAFEATARHERFTAADRNVTQGAVSHQVKALEAELGLNLRESKRLWGAPGQPRQDRDSPVIRRGFDPRESCPADGGAVSARFGPLPRQPCSGWRPANSG